MAIPSADYDADAILQDGSSIRIRALRSDDKALLAELFSRLSQRSVYFKFFRVREWLSDGELARLTELDFANSVGLGATLWEGGRERIIGICRYDVIREGRRPPCRAEAAFAVAEGFQGKGIGTLLLEHIVAIARSCGIAELEANVLEENSQMLQVFADSGFRLKQTLQDGVMHLSLPTKETEESAEAHLGRECRAAAASMRVFLEPKSIAIVGASRQPGTIGAALVSNIKGCGFKGAIYPVNPKASEIEALKTYGSVSAIGQKVDVALIAVPAPMVEQAIRDCAGAGVKGAIVISSGFGEVSPEGRAIEKRLRRVARSAGMRMVGPNCMGLLNTRPDISLNATFVPTWPPAGNIGLVSQSGALGYVILDHIQSLNVGLSSFVSVGNKADVSGDDLLTYWAEDPQTKVVMLYLESFADPRKFSRIAPRVSRSKPIVALKAGRSAAGTRAAASHTAALASPDIVVDALFEQAGIIRVDTLEDLLDVARLLSSQPLPSGPRVGLITNAGGAGILLADACEAHGLQVPEFASETLDQLKTILPSQAGLANPVDMIASASAEQYAAAIRITGADPKVDSMIVIYIPPQLHPPEEVARAIASAAGEVPPEKPVLTVFMSSRVASLLTIEGPRGQLPSYRFPENAAKALSAAARYNRWRKRPCGNVLSLESDRCASVRAVIEGILRNSSGPVWLKPEDSAAILRAAGIEVAAGEDVGVMEAPDAAERLGYPLVAKVQSGQILHKSDVGGVILGLKSRRDVTSALETMSQRMKEIGISFDRVLLQREISGGIEAFVGATADPAFGPVLGCGLGGVTVEAIRDVSFRLTPVSDVDAEEMIARLRSARLLDGYRGAAPGDRAALIQVIRRVSALAVLIPEMSELDLNPVKILEAGRGAVVVDCRMKIAGKSAVPCVQ